MEKGILTKWLKAGFMDKRLFHPTKEGTPQGGIISPILATMTLDGLEKILKEKYKKVYITSKVKYAHKVHLIRYADDFIITARSKEVIETEIIPLVETFLKERGLELSKEKTRITHVDEGFDFLGSHIRKYNGKLIIKPSEDNVRAIATKIRGMIRRNKQATAGELISYLNPVIKGWANFHQHTCSSSTFRKIDAITFKALWKWALRRHRRKGKKWIKKKYFRREGNRNWTFFGEQFIGNERRKVYAKLFYASDVKIRRYTKIRTKANPFDREWETYFEQRSQHQMQQTLQGRKQLLFLWREQNGQCPVCKLSITEETGWHNHHIQWRMHGGKDSSENRVLLHPDCHRKVHSLKLHVVKPRRRKSGVTEA